MSDGWTIDALLGLGIAAACLGCLGFLKRGGALENIKQPIFLAGTTGTAIVLAGLLTEGLTVRVGKLVLLEALLLVSGLVLSNGLAQSARRRIPVMVPSRRSVVPVRRR